MSNKYDDPNKVKAWTLKVRLNENDHNELLLRASANNMSLSNYARRTLFENRFRRIQSDFEIFREFKHAHADLNRLGNYLISNDAKDKLGLEYAFAYREKAQEGIEEINHLIELCKACVRSIRNQNKKYQ